MRMNDKNYFNFSNTQLVIERCKIWYVVHSPPSSYIANNIAVCVVNTILAIFGIILNSLVVFSFWKSARLRSKMCYFATMVLCSTDLAVVAVVQPLFICKIILDILETPSCFYEMLYSFASHVIIGISFCCLFLTNIERYLAIVHPLWHRVHVTKRRFLTSCVYVWVCMSAFPLLSPFTPFVHDVVVPVVTVIMCCATIFIYLSIYLVARKSLSETNRSGVATSQEAVRSSMALWRELKIAKSYFLVAVFTFICHVPAGIITGKESSWYQPERKDINLLEIHGVLWAHTCVLIMSTVNCVVFFWRHRELKEEGSKIIRKCIIPWES